VDTESTEWEFVICLYLLNESINVGTVQTWIIIMRGDSNSKGSGPGRWRSANQTAGHTDNEFLKVSQVIAAFVNIEIFFKCGLDHTSWHPVRFVKLSY
jgi:hypothetical protein